MVLIRLTPKDQVAADRVGANTVIDLLWALAGPDDYVEHICASADQKYINLGLFHLAKTEADAYRAAEQLCRRAIATSPYLNGWTLSRAVGAHHD
jgi:hypothetical protein